MDKSKLLRHVFGTYNWLRYGMAVIAFAFPWLLWGWGKHHGLSLQGSMSAYYWAPIEGDPPVRVLFVGCIFALGACLFLYRGYTIWEELLLDLAALLVILVALFPMSWECRTELGFCGPSVFNQTLHSVFAFAFFACIVYVAFVESGKTLDELQDETLEKRYKRYYWGTRAALIIFPVAAFIAHYLTKRFETLTWSLEVAGIYAFALFWIVKSRELRSSQDSPGVERQVLKDATAGVRHRMP
jgi:uncharacterized membrane protein